VIRGVAFGLGCSMLVACSGTAPVISGAPQATPAAAPALVVGGPSDGNAVPLAVIQNLPGGVSATSVREDASGCFAVLTTGDALAPVNGPSGTQICRS
jgi:hypothetical protein